MAGDARHIDGNGIAGLLAEVADAEITTIVRTCQSCGDRHVLAEHHAHRGAGVVLRCPTCHDVAVVLGVQERRLVVEWRGTYVVERDASPEDEP